MFVWSLKICSIVACRVDIRRSMVSRRVSVAASAEREVDGVKVWRQRVIRVMTPRAIMALGDRRVAMVMLVRWFETP